MKLPWQFNNTENFRITLVACTITQGNIELAWWFWTSTLENMELP